MNWEQASILAILISVLVLFVWGRFRYDVVALLGLFSATLLGLVPQSSLFSGFGHPATITVAIVLILSYGLTKSGAAEGITTLIQPLAKIPSLHIAVVIFISGFLSMFMNNVGALALMMPVAIQSTIRAGRSPSTVLMPLSFGSILGGLVTLIGTPPNIIISSYRQQLTGEPFGMFDFSPVGGVIATVGIIFMAVIGWRLVTVRKATAGLDIFDVEAYLFEVKVPRGSSVIGSSIRELEGSLNEYNINLVSLIHKKQKYSVAPKKHKLVSNDLLLLEGSQEDIDKLVSKHAMHLVGADSAREAILHSADTVVMEVVVPPNSRMEGRSVEQIRFKHYLGINLLAVSRQGRPFRGRLRRFTFKGGDVLLLHGEKEDVEEAITKLSCYPLAERKLDFGKRKFAIPALLIFITAIALAAFDILPIPVTLGCAVVAMVIGNIIPVRELYDGVDWPVVVLLGAMIPIGEALENTGATKLLADNLLLLSGGASLVVLLALVLVITMTLSDILNNAATAILMAPIAKNISEAVGVGPDPFLMAVAIGASCAFLTPIGHQNNALVLGPGGYQFGDYWRMGLPLEVLIVLVAIPMILIVWPFIPA